MGTYSMENNIDSTIRKQTVSTFEHSELSEISSTQYEHNHNHSKLDINKIIDDELSNSGSISSDDYDSHTKYKRICSQNDCSQNNCSQKHDNDDNDDDSVIFINMKQKTESSINEADQLLTPLSFLVVNNATIDNRDDNIMEKIYLDHINIMEKRKQSIPSLPESETSEPNTWDINDYYDEDIDDHIKLISSTQNKEE